MKHIRSVTIVPIDSLEKCNPSDYPSLGINGVRFTNYTKGQIYILKYRVSRLLDIDTRIISNPEIKTALHVVYGHREYFGYNGKYFVRLSWRDVGVKDRRSGLRMTIDGKLVYFLVEYQFSDEDYRYLESDIPRWFNLKEPHT